MHYVVKDYTAIYHQGTLASCEQYVRNSDVFSISANRYVILTPNAKRYFIRPDGAVKPNKVDELKDCARIEHVVGGPTK